MLKYRYKVAREILNVLQIFLNLDWACLTKTAESQSAACRPLLISFNQSIITGLVKIDTGAIYHRNTYLHCCLRRLI